MTPLTESVPPRTFQSLRAGAGDGPVRAADLVEGREAVILLAGADQAEVEGILAGAAELERAGAGAEHEAVDDAARARASARCCRSRRVRSPRSRAAALIVPELKTVPVPLHDANADRARADIDRSGVDDGIAAAETGDIDADGEAGSDGDGAAVGDGVGIAEHDDADGMVAEKDAACCC